MQEYAFMVHRIPVGILGGSGYAGRELGRILASHPKFEVAFATAKERRGEPFAVGDRELTLLAPDDAPLKSVELVFSALPHGASELWVDRVSSNGVRAVDLSSDLRPGHTSRDVPYGLTELFRADLVDAEIIANPGCYPTAILLALLPLLEGDHIESGALVTIDAASGVSGAGNAPRPELLFAEVAENFRAYGVGNEHRHLAEMRETVGRFNRDVDLLFTPHLLPVARGILATITVPLRRMPTDLLAVWQQRYAGEPFVEVREQLPALRDVIRRNVVRITARPVAHVRRPTVIVFSAIDNLVKGAAGQAIQNANVAFGIPETTGLLG
ncbi:MAG: N-acetyl-gamma-glutamyl-phosphate reductase [Gemmatimonadaceae bacterium]|nr:N-acetyl-gamma-glutamyl-phosphate reductase [Gemmatimonadaceae bacterium]